MARRYDSRTTIFSPEGRLYQVEYAMEAISNAGAAIGMLCNDGVVLVAEKKITSKLLDTHAVGVRREKMYRLDDHMCCAVAGITGAPPRGSCSVRAAAGRGGRWGTTSSPLLRGTLLQACVAAGTSVLWQLQLQPVDHHQRSSSSVRVCMCSGEAPVTVPVHCQRRGLQCGLSPVLCRQLVQPASL